MIYNFYRVSYGSRVVLLLALYVSMYLIPNNLKKEKFLSPANLRLENKWVGPSVYSRSFSLIAPCGEEQNSIDTAGGQREEWYSRVDVGHYSRCDSPRGCQPSYPTGAPPDVLLSKREAVLVRRDVLP